MDQRKKIDTDFLEYISEHPSPKAQEYYRKSHGYKDTSEKAQGAVRIIACVVAGGFLWRFIPHVLEQPLLSLKVLGCFISALVILNGLSSVIDDEDKQM